MRIESEGGPSEAKKLGGHKWLLRSHLGNRPTTPERFFERGDGSRPNFVLEAFMDYD